MAKRKIQIPKTLGGCADRLYKLRDEKKVAQAKVDAIDEEFKAIKAHLIEKLPKNNAEGVTGRFANAQIKKKNIPQVQDWEKFYAFVRRTKDFSLLQRRVSEGAVKERWESGKKVPGVEPFNVLSISVTKKK